MSDTPPYSDITVELVTAATEQHYLSDGQTDAMGNSQCSCGQWWDAAGDNPGWDQHMAEVTLGALATAGLLLEGAETQWGLRRDDRESVAPYASRENAEYWQMFAVEEWELVSRQVGPWSAVPPEPKEGAGGQPSPA